MTQDEFEKIRYGDKVHGVVYKENVIFFAQTHRFGETFVWIKRKKIDNKYEQIPYVKQEFLKSFNIIKGEKK